MRNFKLVLSYDGTDFNGWQFQPGRRTVQGLLEETIVSVTGSQSHANASGRTDAGVHAAAQVVSFHSDTRLTPDAIKKALYANLPADVAVSHAEEMPPTFHAIRDAVRKMYRYVIRDNPVHDPFLVRFHYHSRQRMDEAAMDRAARVLVGCHDFRSFETDWPRRVSSVRTITHLTVSRAGDLIWIDVEADGFLYNMVRAIAGTLMNVGRGYWPENKVAEALAALDRREAGPNAAAQGLFLMRVSY